MSLVMLIVWDVMSNTFITVGQSSNHLLTSGHRHVHLVWALSVKVKFFSWKEEYTKTTLYGNTMCMDFVHVSVIFMQLGKQYGRNGRRGTMFWCKCHNIHLLCVATKRRSLSHRKWCNWMDTQWITLSLPVVSHLYDTIFCVFSD
jgi:hypothetical protein